MTQRSSTDLRNNFCICKRRIVLISNPENKTKYIQALRCSLVPSLYSPAFSHIHTHTHCVRKKAGNEGIQDVQREALTAHQHIYVCVHENSHPPPYIHTPTHAIHDRNLGLQSDVCSSIPGFP